MLHSLSTKPQTTLVTLAVHSMMLMAVGAHAEQLSRPSGWRWGPLLPERRTAFGCCATDDSVVTIGGTYWTGINSLEPKKVWLSDTYRLKRNAGMWESLPAFPVPIDYALVVAVNDRIFTIGGQNGDGIRAETYSLALDEPTARWQPGPDLPRPLSRLRGGVWGDVIVAVTDESAAESAEARRPPKILTWDTADKQKGWLEITEVPEATIGFRAAAIASGKLYVFGGAEYDSPERLRLCAKVWSYDLEHNKWSDCSPLPIPLRDATARKINERFIVLGGGVEEAVDASSAPDQQPRIILSTRCLVYDCDNDRFTTFEPLRLAVADHGLAIMGDELFVVGGEDSPYRTRTDLVQRCDTKSLIDTASQPNVQRQDRTHDE
jgi:N-acetylneuraminic acid mutarotase